MLPALNNEHNEIINKSIRHDWSVPEFKVKHFVAGSHIHPLHKIKQYLMELGSRYENLEIFENDIKKIALEIELLEEQQLDMRYEAEKKLAQLEIMVKTRALAIAKEKFRNADSEVKKYLRLIDEFNNSNEGKNDQGKLYMDIMNDPVECEKIEAQYWEYRLAKQAALDMIAYGRVGIGNMEAIMQLDADAQNKCIAMAYEVLLTNESRMNQISDSVVHLLKNGQTVSDINKLIQIEKTDFVHQLENKTQENTPNVPLIQKC